MVRRGKASHGMEGICFIKSMYLILILGVARLGGVRCGVARFGEAPHGVVYDL
jgi:hypothetical protein